MEKKKVDVDAVLNDSDKLLQEAYDQAFAAELKKEKLLLFEEQKEEFQEKARKAAREKARSKGLVGDILDMIKGWI